MGAVNQNLMLAVCAFLCCNGYTEISNHNCGLELHILSLVFYCCWVFLCMEINQFSIDPYLTSLLK